MQNQIGISASSNIIPASAGQNVSFETKSKDQDLYKPILNFLPVQCKLSVGAINDPLEDEADAMADKVMRMPEQNFIQKKCAHCEEEEKAQRKPLASFIQKKSSGSNSAAVSDTISSQIESTKGSGKAMNERTKSFMESRFGTDFSNINIHTDNNAAQLSTQLSAQAFTVGNDIYFNEGKYQPESSDGKRLLAHELTHTVQQNGSSILAMLIQRSLTIAPTVPGAVPNVLTTAETTRAIKWNNAAFANADEVSLLRGVLSISDVPAVIDEDFIKAVVQYQASFGLSQDGLLGSGTAKRLADELQAEATTAGAGADTATGTAIALNPAQRRMNLRSRVVNRLGQMLHQGFIGPADSPTGIVSVRSGFNDPNVTTPGFRDTNTIGINYTGTNVANSKWLQFAFRQMSAIDPATKRRAYNGGSVTTSGGTHNYSDASTFHWNVDTVPAAGNMYYEARGGNQRTGTHTEIFDQPAGWNRQADAFAGTFATRPASVRMINGFHTFLVVNNNKVAYHVRWNVYFNFNTSVTPTPDVTGSYEVLTAGVASKLPAALKTALDAQFPTNTVP